MVRINYQEIILHSILSLSPLMPHYFSTLLTYATQLLEDQEIREMEMMIGRVEAMVNGIERFMIQNDDGTIQIRERPAGNMTLYDIEMAMESNPDYYSYFERPDGKKVTKFDVERELDKIRKWVFLKVKERAYQTRFTRM